MSPLSKSITKVYVTVGAKTWLVVGPDRNPYPLSILDMGSQIPAPQRYSQVCWSNSNPRNHSNSLAPTHRVVKFVNLFPHLAGYVQNLLIRVPPDNTASAIDDLAATKRFLRTTVSRFKDLTEAHEEIYHQLTVAPLRLWKDLAEDDVAIADRVRLTFSSLRP